MNDCMEIFDVAFYRSQNRDLADLGMSDGQLRDHFQAHGVREARPYAKTDTTAASMSMRWLRGSGIEVGAGKWPTPMFGFSSLEFGEVDRKFAFGGKAATHWFDIGGEAPASLRDRYDFAIASHVLEHCDSLLRGIVNMLDVVRSDGLAYIVLPDKRHLGDKEFIIDFDIKHHLDEFEMPLLYADIHDSAYMIYAPVEEYANEHAVLAQEYRDQIRDGRIAPEFRFMHHKHNYSFAKWLEVMSGLQSETGFFDIEDAAFGRDRLDCHFVLRKKPAFKPAPPIRNDP